MSERAAPFHCPYCGEETLRPLDPEPDAGPGATGPTGTDWRCESCTRAFTLRYRGLTRRPE